MCLDGALWAGALAARQAVRGGSTRAAGGNAALRRSARGDGEARTVRGGQDGRRESGTKRSRRAARHEDRAAGAGTRPAAWRAQGPCSKRPRSGGV